MKRKRISQVIVFAVTCMGSVCFIGNRDQCERTAKAMNGEVAPLHIVRDNHVKTRENYVNRIDVNSLTKQDGECKVFIPAIGSSNLNPDSHPDDEPTRLRAYNRWKYNRAVQSIQNEFKLYNDRHAEAVAVSVDKRKGKDERDERVRRLFKKITSQDIQTLENISLITSSAT